MKSVPANPSSLRRNVFSFVGLFAMSLVVAAGCPLTHSTPERSASSHEAGAARTGRIAATWSPSEDRARRDVGAQPDGSASPADYDQKRLEESSVVKLAAYFEADEAEAERADKSDAADNVSKSNANKNNASPATPNGAPEALAEPFDPIKVNGKFFQNWQTPKVALVISGRQDGYLEPCGCAGLENQKGGIGRRHALFKELMERGWPVAAVDVGSQVRRFGKQAEIQFAIATEALKIMKYDAVAFGPEDLRLSAGDVAAAVAGDDPTRSMFISANANVLGLTPKARIFERGGLKIGVTAIVGKSMQEKVNNADVEMTEPIAALAEPIAELAVCDHRILLAHASLEESGELAKRFPQFDIVVTAGGPDEPRAFATQAKGAKSMLVEVGHKGMYVVVLGLNGKQKPIAYQRVALDSRFKATEAMKGLMTSYQEQLKSLGWEGLGLRPAKHPKASTKNPHGGDFAGSESCKKCHTKAWAVWSKSKHAEATQTLVKADPPRQFDPECASCHVTGWNAAEFFPYKSGFVSLEETPRLVGNGCENCHGPGAAHVTAETTRDRVKRESLRDQMRLSAGSAADNVCNRCHDLDNSPHFKFETNWPKVQHRGKD